MHIKKGDTVIVRSGKDRGKQGKVLEVLPRENRVVIEGVHIVSKHERPKRTRQKGQRIHVPLPIPAARVSLICPHCSRPARPKTVLLDRAKERACRKCGQRI